jgi:uncharacterized protein YjbI with pentapeptide repeats
LRSKLKMAEKLDPYDVTGLQSSLSDSASRVSTIWISYLLFGLYLLVATGTASHRQLLLEEGLKLPALGTEVPLFWFFVLSPALLILLHFYVLLQVLLLGRTAAAYNRAVDRALRLPRDNALLRERLANTLFAQAFAGAPREREGWLGRILYGIAWVTLVVAPIYIIFAFQFVFLPYHSPLATWAHRLFVLVELATAVVFWPIVLDPRKDFDRVRLRRQLRRLITLPRNFVNAESVKRYRLNRACAHVASLAGCFVLFLVSLFVLSFPGEWHINFLTLNEPNSVQCDRWITQHFDRLVFRNVSVADEERLKRISNAVVQTGQSPWEGERTRTFDNRDLNCGVFDFADLRYASFAGARLSGASLRHARLGGAELEAVHLEGADLSFGQLEDAHLTQAKARGVKLGNALLSRAVLNKAELQAADFSLVAAPGANFGNAKMQGANLIRARLPAATLTGARLDGASLKNAQLDGADLTAATLAEADLTDATIQATDLSASDLSGAWLDGTLLQGAELQRVTFDHAVLSKVFLWRSKHANCSLAHVSQSNFEEVLAVPRLKFDEKIDAEAVPPPLTVQATDPNTLAFADRVSQDKKSIERIRKLLGEESGFNETRQSCTGDPLKPPYNELDLANFIAERVCNEETNGGEIAAGVIRNAINRNVLTSPYFIGLSRSFLACTARVQLGVEDRKLLENTLRTADETGFAVTP